MAVSRMIYVRKLMAMFGDDRLDGPYLRTYCVIPRFMRILKGEYLSCRRSGDAKRAAEFRAGMEEIGSHLPARTRVKLRVKLFGLRITMRLKLPRKWAMRTLTSIDDSKLAYRPAWLRLRSRHANRAKEPAQTDWYD